MPGDVAAFYLENRMGSVAALIDYRHLVGDRDVYGPASPTADKVTPHYGSVVTESRRARVIKYAKYDAFGHATWMDTNDGLLNTNGWEDSPYTLRDNADLPSTERYDTTFEQPYGWQAKRQSKLTGIYYSRYRDYSPVIGRFLSRDPLGYIDGPNDRQFANNRMIQFRDPYGLLRSREDAERTGNQRWIGDNVTDITRDLATIEESIEFDEVIREGDICFTITLSASVTYQFVGQRGQWRLQIEKSYHSARDVARYEALLRQIRAARQTRTAYQALAVASFWNPKAAAAFAAAAFAADQVVGGLQQRLNSLRQTAQLVTEWFDTDTTRQGAMGHVITRVGEVSEVRSEPFECPCDDETISLEVFRQRHQPYSQHFTADDLLGDHGLAGFADVTNPTLLTDIERAFEALANGDD